jgi:predicted TIM-barrel enzyme
LPAELEALLPNRRHNDDLMAGLQSSLGKAHVQDGAIAAVFAADPFINVREMTSALARIGIGSVANFPSVAQYGKAFELSLSEVGLGVQRELAILAQFRKLGLRTYQTLAEHPQASFDPDGHAGFLIAISFDDLHGAIGREDVLRTRKRWARSRVGAEQSTLICRAPEREGTESEGGSIVIWPLD